MPPQAEQAARSLVIASAWRFVLLRTTQMLAVSLLWLLMAFVAVNAFIVAVGGIFFWEYAEVPDLTAPQAAGGGILTAGVLILVVLGLLKAYRSIKRMEFARREVSEPVVE
jgi:hypothetical protein